MFKRYLNIMHICVPPNLRQVGSSHPTSGEIPDAKHRDDSGLPPGSGMKLACDVLFSAVSRFTNKNKNKNKTWENPCL